MTPPAFTPFGGDDIEDPGPEAAKIVVLPLPYEKGASYGAGAKYGPFHLLSASEQLERLDEETLIDWGDLKLHTVGPPHLPDEPEAAVNAMEAAAGDILDRRQRLLAIGGDHAIAIGPIRAAARRHPDIGVLQIDAHPDLRDNWNGSRYNHACVMRRVLEDMGLPMVQVGMRTISPEERDLIRQRNLHPFWAHDIDPMNPRRPMDLCRPMDLRWIDAVVARLPRKVYLTFDLDGLDPSVLPGTGAPEPGGLTYRQAVALIRTLGRERDLIAADICELSKIPGTQVSEYTAAKIASKIFVHCWRRIAE